MQKNVLEYLENIYQKYPDKIGYFDENISLTFAEIRNKSRKAATNIIKLFNIHNKPIAVLLPKNVYSLIIFHSITYSGNIYVPIDINQPVNRIHKILQTLNIECIISDSKTVNLLDDKYKNMVIDINEIEKFDTDDVLLNNIMAKQISTDPLYIIFTSGSTGEPKGVVINHQAVIDYIEWIQNTYNFSSNDIIANQVPFYFDVSVTDIYMTLKMGCKLYIIPERYFAFAGKLLQELSDKKVTIIFWVPSALISIANSGLLENFTYKGLNKILFAGEVMPNKQLNIWRKYLPEPLYSNLYGPTEITVIALYYIVDREFADDEVLPMGKPCRNMDIFLLSDENKLIEKENVNIKGEIYIRGMGLSSGYYNNIDKTNNAFVQNPLNSSYPEYVYKTGDLAYYNEYGELVYSCRKDFQIKHNGYRIELGEIESAASSLDDIYSACCLYDENNKKIWLFYSALSHIEEDTIKRLLLKYIPRYELPNYYYFIKEMPLTANGKIDRQSLKTIMGEFTK